MSTHLADKSLEHEASLGGWALRRRREFAEPGVGPHYAPDRSCRIVHLDVELTIDPQAKRLRGVAVLKCEPLPGAGGRYVFDLDELTVDEVVDGHGGRLGWTHRDGRLEVDPSDTIRVCWHGSPRRGLYWVEAAAGPEAWTQCQDEDARFILPCFDHPSAKHPWSIRVNAPAGYGVMSNGTRAGDAWEVAEPMPAYLFSVVVMRMDVHRATRGRVPIAYAVPAGASADEVERAFGKTPEMVDFLSELYRPYPWSRYDQVVVHEFVFGGMENLACTTLLEAVLVDARAALDHDLDTLVVHELGHQWFGDLLTCQDWSQGWLNEGWATYTEHLWLAHDRGADEAEWHHWENLVAYLAEDGGRYRRPIVSYAFREPIDVFDRHLYEKAGLVLHTLRTTLGDEAFWSGTRTYLARHAHQTVHTRHFQRAMEDASGRNLDRFFADWLYSPGHPVLEVSTEHADGVLTVVVKQTQSGPGVPEAFHLPLVVRIDGRVHRFAVTSRESRFHLVGTEPSHVSVDPGFGLLAEIKLRLSRSQLLREFRDGSVVGRIRAAKALADDGGPEAVEGLRVSLATDPFWGVKAEVAALLGARGDAGALLGRLGEPHPKARRAVVAALAGIRRPEVVAALEALPEDPSIAVEGEVARALGRLQAPGARARCERLLAQDSWLDLLRARALEGLGSTRQADVLSLVLSWTTPDRPTRARAAACAALAKLADDVESVRQAVVERLVELCDDPNFRVQVAAVNAAGVVRDARAVPVLERLHGSAGDGRCRRLAWEALCAIREGRTGEDALQGVRRELEVLVEENRKLRSRVERLEPKSG